MRGGETDLSMRIHPLGELRHFALRATGWLRSKVLILLYHRVAELPCDPQLLSVTPKHFEEHLEVLRRLGRPISLQELAKRLRSGNLLHRSVVLTFDDGYADNLRNAEPMLERHGFPATAFVTTGYAGGSREFWWDELERLLLQPGTLPPTLCVSVNGSVARWDLGDAAVYGDDDYGRYRGWNVLETGDPTPRHAVYRVLCPLLRPLPEGDRRKALDQLGALAPTEAAPRAVNRPLSVADVSRLPENGLVEVGAHTVTHSVLSPLSGPAQKAEIEGSKRWLEEVLGHPVSAFSYPYGKRSDYTPETVALVREAGFGCACSNFAGVVGRDTDLFELPRILIRDWDGDEFARRPRAYLVDR